MDTFSQAADGSSNAGSIIKLKCLEVHNLKKKNDQISTYLVRAYDEIIFNLYFIIQ